jgi:hypothetical protein
MARQGKIARLPELVREELNKRLRAGQLGPTILPWLNEVAEVKQVLTDHFGGAAVNAQNLSDWRNGGYEEWVEKQDRTYRIKELASYAVKLAEANGSSIAEGSAAIVSGKWMDVLEAATGDEKIGLEDLKEITSSLVSLRSAEIAQQRADTDKEKLKQRDEQLKLEREKFQRQTAEMVLKSAKDAAVQRIASAPMDYSEQLNQVGKHLYGDLWK